eukprot:g9524.t1
MYCNNGHAMAAPGLAPGTQVACPTCDLITVVPEGLQRPSGDMPMQSYGGQQDSFGGDLHMHMGHGQGAAHNTEPVPFRNADDQDNDRGNVNNPAGQATFEGETVAKANLDFQGGKCRDAFWAILWMGDVLAIILVAFAYGGPWITELQNEQGDSTDASTDINYGVLIGSGVASSIFAVVWAYFWLKVMQLYAGGVIKCGMVINVVLWVVFAVYMFAVGMLFGAIISVIFIAILAMYYRMVRDRIPFAEAILSACTEALRANSATVCVTMVFAVLSIGWSLLWNVAAGAYIYHADGSDNHLSAGENFVIFLLVLSFYWTTQVFQNIGHVTTAGAVAMWWLQPEATGKVMGALKRACTTSLGSICMGSLIVAVLKAIKWALNEAMNQENECVRCIVLCIIGCIESLVEYFNKYAYTYVAIYGRDFMTSAKDTWTMFKSRGFTAIINDDLSGLALGMGVLFGALVGAAIGAVFGAFSPNCDKVCMGLGALLGLVCAALIVSLVMGVMESAICTTFVLWAEDPATLRSKRPAPFQRILDAVPGGRYPDARLE